MTLERIPIAGPWITDREIELVADAARNAWYERAGEYNTRFERAFAERLGMPYAISLPSGTAAVHLALAALGVGPGDEVVVPDATWIACSAPVHYLGATPVFADIDRVTWCLAPESLEARIGSRTRAVVAVDLYGNVPEMDAIRAVAERHGIGVVEDAAEALGSTYRGRDAGTLGDVGVFSFHGSKTMTTGEGGMVVMREEALYRRCQMLRDHGRRPDEYKRFWNHEIAYKYKMSAVQAALGIGQLERLDELVARKREIFGWYVEELGELDGIALNDPGADVVSSYWMTTAVLDPRFGLEKEAVVERLAADGIDCRPFFYPLTSLPAYADHPQAPHGAELNPVSYEISRYGVNLPSALSLSRDQVARVCAAIRRELGLPS